MTNHNNNRDIRELISDLAERQVNTQMQLDSFLQTAERVLARSAVLDDVVQELRDTTEQHQHNFEQHLQNFDQHQRNFEENQKSTNAALQRLEAILMQLIKNNGDGE